MYLDEARRKFEYLPAKLQMSEYERRAYMRLKIRITKYKETTRGIAGDLRAVVFGKIEGVEVYADTKKMKPMYISEIKDKRLRRFRRPAVRQPSGVPPKLEAPATE